MTAGQGRESWIDLGVVRAEPELQLALDEVLLQSVASNLRPCMIRFWEWTAPCLVLGSNQSIANEIDVASASRHGFGLARRLSGGGTMICEPGRTITWSVYLPEALVAGLSFRDSYFRLDAWAVRALERLGLEVEYRPINEIASPLGKIAGAAQARRRGAVLHHVTMAHAIDPALVTRLIRIGRERISARGVRSAEREVSPLEWFVDLTWAEVVAALRRTFAEENAPVPGEITQSEWEAARALADVKYRSREWLYRSP